MVVNFRLLRARYIIRRLRGRQKRFLCTARKMRKFTYYFRWSRETYFALTKSLMTWKESLLDDANRTVTHQLKADWLKNSDSQSLEFVGLPSYRQCCRSRIPVIGFVRLRRALGGVIPLFDPIPWESREIGRHGNGDTGDSVTPVCIETVKIRSEGGWKWSNSLPTGGLLRVSRDTRGVRWKLEHLVLRGASSLDRCIAQACHCIGRRCIWVSGIKPWVRDSGNERWIFLLSKGDALESRSPENC